MSLVRVDWKFVSGAFVLALVLLLSMPIVALAQLHEYSLGENAKQCAKDSEPKDHFLAGPNDPLWGPQLVCSISQTDSANGYGLSTIVWSTTPYPKPGERFDDACDRLWESYDEETRESFREWALAEAKSIAIADCERKITFRCQQLIDANTCPHGCNEACVKSSECEIVATTEPTRVIGIDRELDSNTCVIGAQARAIGEYTYTCSSSQI